MKSYMAKAGEYERKWYVVDAEGMVLGRLATQIAMVLRGKDKPTYTPNVDTGDFIIVINADKIVLTGKKLEQKSYKYHTGYVGGLRSVTYKHIMENSPEVAVERAVKGMLPKTKLGRGMYKRLFVYSGPDHKHQAQKPEPLKFN